MCYILGMVDFENSCDINTVLAGCTVAEQKSVYVTNYAMLLHGHSKSGLQENKIGSMTLAYRARLYTAIYMGDISNAEILRETLLCAGAQFRCGGTAELLIYSYIFYDNSCAERICGDIDFCIYDEYRERLFLSSGLKDIYYVNEESAFVFSTNPDRVNEHSCGGGVKSLKNGTAAVFERCGLRVLK